MLTVQCAIYLAEVLPGTMTVEHIDVTESLLAGQELILRRLARERDVISHSVALVDHPLASRGWAVSFQIRQRNLPRWKESPEEMPPVIVMLSGYLKAHFDLWVVELE